MKKRYIMLLIISFLSYGALNARPYSKFNFYITHMATDLVAWTGIPAGCLAGFIAGQCLENILKTSKRPQTLTNASITIGALLGVYAHYKMPQWTNKYIFDNEALNDSIQTNCVSFILRVFFSYPLGTLLSALNYELANEAY